MKKIQIKEKRLKRPSDFSEKHYSLLVSLHPTNEAGPPVGSAAVLKLSAGPV